MTCDRCGNDKEPTRVKSRLCRSCDRITSGRKRVVRITLSEDTYQFFVARCGETPIEDYIAMLSENFYKKATGR